MLKDTVVVKNKTGIHARPAGMLAKTVGQYHSAVELIYNQKTIKAKSVMALLSAGIKGGSEIEIICDGEDEQEVMTDVKALFADGFGEKE